MTPGKTPETLADLLRTLERSEDLRPLARECGVSVRELRRRLSRWRRDLDQGEPTPAPAKSTAKKSEFEELPMAAALDECPLPDEGSAVLEVYTDGASRGNPGPAAIGAVFRQKGGPALCALGESIGRATNNQAEYQAVVAALGHCDRWGVARVHLFVDSELVARQLTGAYRVKSQDLRPLYQQAQHLARNFKEFRVRHVPRAKNTHADHLANLALDGR
ncbi:reverse transcriptase-like protein [bacterium]|nr:reverse transcriptase-like protein [bacterium]